MKHTKKPLKFKSPKFAWNFNSKKLSLYGGIAPIMDYLKRIDLPEAFDSLFPTTAHQARKFSVTHLMLSVILASLSGVNRLTSIATFTWDLLIQCALGLVKGLNKDVVSTELKRLGQSGARLLEDMFGYRVKRVLEESGREELTVDADSTVRMVYGKQEGAAKGFNPKKRGAWSYHPIIIFATEIAKGEKAKVLLLFPYIYIFRLCSFLRGAKGKKAKL